MTPLDGRVALVTGASGGLGRAIAVGLARAGADVACHYGSDAENAAESVRQVIDAGRRGVALPADLREVDAGRHLVDATLAHLGRLDILVNNAGMMSTSPFLELSVAEWDEVVDLNLRAYFLVGQAAARVMAATGKGVIVNVSSTREQQAWAGSTAYASAKGGIRMLTRVMALELAPLGVRVNAIAPGTIETDLNRHYLADAAFRSKRVATIPAGRLGEPQDVVAAVVLLASDDSGFIVGASLLIDGGQTLG